MSDNIDEAINRNKESYDEIQAWIDKCYQKDFAQYFAVPDTLYEKMKSDKITDDELSSILIDLPLDLMSVSTNLGRYKLFKDVIKIESKKMKLEKQDQDKSNQALNNELVMIGQANLVEIVEKKVTMCKELIMGAKKLWDARRSTENVNPVSEIDIEDLPDYKPKGE